MTDHIHPTNLHARAGEPPLEAELAAIDVALDELAARDAASMSAAFEDRIALATRPTTLAGSSAAGGSAEVVYSFKERRDRDAWMSPARIAAMIAIVFTAGFTWIAVRGGFPAAGPAGGIRTSEVASAEQDVNTWLGITDTNLAELSQLALDSDTLDRSLRDEPSAGAWFLDGEPL